jgi:hypothetical protein
VFRADLDGSNVEEVVSAFGEDTYGIALDLDNDMLYISCSETNTDTIKQVDLSGSLPAAATTLVQDNTNIDVPIALAYINNTLYWCNDGTNQDIKSAQLPVTTVNAVSTDATSKYGLVVVE